LIATGLYAIVPHRLNDRLALFRSLIILRISLLSFWA